MKKALKLTLWILVALLFIGTFVYLWYNSRPKADEYNLVTPVTQCDIKRTSVLTGKIEPRDEINIKPQISGIISEILVEPGDHVNDGDIIARIKVIPDASQLSSAQNRIDVALISLEDARLKYERAKMLFEKKVGSREEFETAEANYERAKAELESAEDAYSIVKEGISKTNASESNTNVRATITGLVLDVPVKVGASVIQANTFNDGTTIAVVADMNNLIFKGKADETEVGTLAVGMPMEITIGALPQLRPTAVVEYISPKGEETNGANTFEIKGALSLPEGVTLRSGYSANATVVLQSVNAAVAIPESVVEFAGDSTYVYVLADTTGTQRFERRSFTAGLSDGVNMEAKEGIDENMKLRGSLILK